MQLFKVKWGMLIVQLSCADELFKWIHQIHILEAKDVEMCVLSLGGLFRLPGDQVYIVSNHCAIACPNKATNNKNSLLLRS